jgi:hypothetical protein
MSPTTDTTYGAPFFGNVPASNPVVKLNTCTASPILHMFLNHIVKLNECKKKEKKKGRKKDEKIVEPWFLLCT